MSKPVSLIIITKEKVKRSDGTYCYNYSLGQPNQMNYVIIGYPDNTIPESFAIKVLEAIQSKGNEAEIKLMYFEKKTVK